MKNYLFSAIRHFWSPPEKIYKHLHFNGIFRVQVNENIIFKMCHYHSHLENEIFWKGLVGWYEGQSTKLWISLCMTSKTIFDVGANTGIYSLIAKAVNKDSTVYAFEPIDRIYQKLKYNIIMNEYDIIPFRKALSNTSQKRMIYDTPEELEYIVSLSHNAFGNEGILVEIETDTLYDFIKAHQISRIDLIKLDVQHHEFEVLLGMKDLLSEHKPTLLIEILEDRLAEKLEALTTDIGYLYFDVNEEKGPILKEHLQKASHSNFLICSREVAHQMKLID